MLGFEERVALQFVVCMETLAVMVMDFILLT